MKHQEINVKETKIQKQSLPLRTDRNLANEEIFRPV
jgi:hypothetical protein